MTTTHEKELNIGPLGSSGRQLNRLVGHRLRQAFVSRSQVAVQPQFRLRDPLTQHDNIANNDENDDHSSQDAYTDTGDQASSILTGFLIS